VRVRLLALVLVALTASGCAAAAVAAVGVAAMSDAAGGVAKAGVEHTMGGSTYRTFSAPLPEVRAAVLRSFYELEIDVTKDEAREDGRARIMGRAQSREITVNLEPVTPVLTRLKMFVRKGWLGRDRATSDQLIEQTARALAEISPIAGASPRAP
jgi:uncharacterized protein DUF3568